MTSPVIEARWMGRRFGRLTVIQYQGTRKENCICRCDCGTIKEIQRGNLKGERIKSCGCLSQEVTGLRVITHGMSRTPTYHTWSRILQRCQNPMHCKYSDYGGRGIRVCERWQTFENFLADMGEKPPGLSIDRINNDGNYESGNCRWTDMMTQAQNTRKNVNVTVNGKTQCASAWAREMGVSRQLLFYRLSAGQPIEGKRKAQKQRMNGE